MKNYKNTHTSVIAMKATIKGLQHMSKDLRKQIHVQTEDHPREALRARKEQLGWKSRYALAAYALMRGVPFYKVEQRSAEPLNTMGDAKEVLKYINIFLTRGHWTPEGVLEKLTEVKPCQK